MRRPPWRNGINLARSLAEPFPEATAITEAAAIVAGAITAITPLSAVRITERATPPSGMGITRAGTRIKAAAGAAQQCRNIDLGRHARELLLRLLRAKPRRPMTAGRCLIVLANSGGPQPYLTSPVRSRELIPLVSCGT
jgi:hypothetical protein